MSWGERVGTLLASAGFAGMSVIGFSGDPAQNIGGINQIVGCSAVLLSAAFLAVGIRGKRTTRCVKCGPAPIEARAYRLGRKVQVVR